MTLLNFFPIFFEVRRICQVKVYSLLVLMLKLCYLFDIFIRTALWLYSDLLVANINAKNNHYGYKDGKANSDTDNCALGGNALALIIICI